MGDGTETERMLKEWGLEETVTEVFSGSMDKKAITTTEIEIPTKKILRALQNENLPDSDIIGYLEELEDGTEKEIVLEEFGQSPWTQYIYITFKDGLEICL